MVAGRGEGRGNWFNTERCKNVVALGVNTVLIEKQKKCKSERLSLKYTKKIINVLISLSQDKNEILNILKTFAFKA